MTDPLPAALLELLARGPATPTQLQQQLADAGAPMHYEVVVAALRKLAGSGRAVQYTGGTWALAESCTRPQDTQETNVATKKCPACEETKPTAEFYANGYCKPCGAAKSREYAAKKSGAPAKPAKAARPVKAAASAAPPATRSEAAPALRVVSRVMVALVDADGAEHAFALTLEQAVELREALA
jgi:hypothetical protein